MSYIWTGERLTRFRIVQGHGVSVMAYLRTRETLRWLQSRCQTFHEHDQNEANKSSTYVQPGHTRLCSRNLNAVAPTNTIGGTRGLEQPLIRRLCVRFISSYFSVVYRHLVVEGPSVIWKILHTGNLTVNKLAHWSSLAKVWDFEGRLGALQNDWYEA